MLSPGYTSESSKGQGRANALRVSEPVAAAEAAEAPRDPELEAVLKS